MTGLEPQCPLKIKNCCSDCNYGWREEGGRQQRHRWPLCQQLPHIDSPLAKGNFSATGKSESIHGHESFLRHLNNSANGEIEAVSSPALMATGKTQTYLRWQERPDTSYPGDRGKRVRFSTSHFNSLPLSSLICKIRE